MIFVIFQEAAILHFQKFKIWTVDPVPGSDILVIEIILVLVLVSFQSNHFYFIEL